MDECSIKLMIWSNGFLLPTHRKSLWFMNQLECYYENMDIPSKAKKKRKYEKIEVSSKTAKRNIRYNISPTKLSEQKISEISVRQWKSEYIYIYILYIYILYICMYLYIHIYIIYNIYNI